MKEQLQRLQVNMNQTEKMIRDPHVRHIYKDNDNFCMQDLKHTRNLKSRLRLNLLQAGYELLVLPDFLSEKAGSPEILSIADLTEKNDILLPLKPFSLTQT